MRFQINYKFLIVIGFVLVFTNAYSQKSVLPDSSYLSYEFALPQDSLLKPDSLLLEKKFKQVGLASYYAPRFHGRRTASGEKYSKNRLTAAHRTLPFGTMVKVTEIKTGKWLIVRINDRGPYARKRIIDLSYAAAKQFGMVKGAGVIKVKIRVVEWPKQ
jgi:rare lipoprotein A